MNATVELLAHIEDRKIKAAKVWWDEFYRHSYSEEDVLMNNSFIHTLYPGYSRQEYKDFMSFLNREYPHIGSWQYLYGTIWYEDGTWSSRDQNNGFEWWTHNKTPQLPMRK